MIKKFSQFNESFKEKIDIFKKDIIDEMKRDLDPILKFSHEVNDILSEYDDLGYSDYKIDQFSICFGTKGIYEEIGPFASGTDTPCLNFNIDLDRNEILILKIAGNDFVEEHGIDKLETFFSKLELLTAGIFIEFNRGVYSSNLKWDKDTLQKLKSEIESRWVYSNFFYLGPGIGSQFNAVLSVKIKDLI